MVSFFFPLSRFLRLSRLPTFSLSCLPSVYVAVSYEGERSIGGWHAKGQGALRVGQRGARPKSPLGTTKAWAGTLLAAPKPRGAVCRERNADK